MPITDPYLLGRIGGGVVVGELGEGGGGRVQG